MKRLFTWLMAAFVAVVLVGTLSRTVFLTISLRRSAQGQTVETSLHDARTIATWASERWERMPGDLRPSLGALATVANARVWLVDSTGNVRVDTEGKPSWEGAHLPDAEFRRILAGGGPAVVDNSPWLGSAVTITAPVMRDQDQRVLGTVFLFLPENGSPYHPPVASDALLWSGVLALGLAAVAAYLLSRTLARPVEEITRFARRLGKGDFSGELQAQSVAEFSELAATLTWASAQLRHSFGALSEERQRLATVLQSMQEGVLVLEAPGEIALMNDAAVQMLRCERPVLPMPITAATGLPGRLCEALTEAAAGASVEVYLRPQGQEDVLAVCSPLISPGGGSGAVAVLHDLGAVMRLQRLRENFIADAAHELRGPLANLSVLAEALGDGTIPWDGREPYVASLQAEVARLHRLSLDVLDLARMDAGVMTVTIEPVTLAGVAASVRFRLTNRAAAAGVTLAASVPEELRVLASPDRLERVIFNLVENAIRHTPAGGTVTLGAGREADTVRLTVADNGAGIPAEHLLHIFERFYKVDPARTRTDAGTGLGLAVVKQLVELQGGSVAVTSEVGRGSVFSVLLPVAAAGTG
jgi:signal transduction histidine kinase